MAQYRSSSQTTDVTDRDARVLGGVRVTDNYQDHYLPLILNELRRISVLLAQMGGSEIDFDEEFGE